MKLTPYQWYDLGCYFSEVGKKLDQLCMLLLVNLGPEHYSTKLAKKICSHCHIVLENELTGLLYKAYPDADYLPEFDNLMLMDVFCNNDKKNLNGTVSYGNSSLVTKTDIIKLCNETMGITDRLYLAYGNVPTPTVNRIIISLMRIVNNMKKLY